MELITALGRLLHDGALRDEFAVHPATVLEQLNVRTADRPALLAISAADLEFQAGILLGKRFDLIQNVIPRTLAALGDRARREFFAYARFNWPKGTNQPLEDAAEFCRHYAREQGARVCQAELNRLNFALGDKMFAAHFVRELPLRRRDRNAVQILLRGRGGKWRESVFYLGL